MQRFLFGFAWIGCWLMSLGCYASAEDVAESCVDFANGRCTGKSIMSALLLVAALVTFVFGAFGAWFMIQGSFIGKQVAQWLRRFSETKLAATLILVAAVALIAVITYAFWALMFLALSHGYRIATILSLLVAVALTILFVISIPVSVAMWASWDEIAYTKDDLNKSSASSH